MGHPRLTRRGHEWAALLAVGGPAWAALSHRTAAGIRGLILSTDALEVTTPRASRGPQGITVHRSRTLAGDVVVDRDGFAITSVARTLIDLADCLTPRQLERACHRAETLRLLDAGVLAERMAALPGRRTRALRAALATLASADPVVTRTELEARFLALIADLGLPRPLVNAQLHGFEVDFLWPGERLVVETDGGAFHRTLTAFEKDRRRDAALAIAGYRVQRFSWQQVVSEPGAVAAAMRVLLDLTASSIPA